MTLKAFNQCGNTQLCIDMIKSNWIRNKNIIFPDFADFSDFFKKCRFNFWFCLFLLPKAFFGKILECRPPIIPHILWGVYTLTFCQKMPLAKEISKTENWSEIFWKNPKNPKNPEKIDFHFKFSLIWTYLFKIECFHAD